MLGVRYAHSSLGPTYTYYFEVFFDDVEAKKATMGDREAQEVTQKEE